MRSGDGKDESFAVHLTVFEVPPGLSPGELKSHLVGGQDSAGEHARYKDQLNRYAAYSDEAHGVACVRYTQFSRDTRPRRQSGSTEPMEFRIYGIACQHPGNSAIVAMVGYSHRFDAVDSERDPDDWPKAARHVVESLEFRTLPISMQE
ncbi:MAG: hypothetical protein R3270_00575 [Gammaproteobacteria bacterium]|nr:hypothetical protein [Gammaproteobacteria bacterium]